MKLTFKEFQELFAKIEQDNTITIRFTKEKNDQIIHKELKLYKEDEKFYLEEIEHNETTKQKNIILAKHEITESSLQKEHSYLATLFATLNPKPVQPVSLWEDFINSDSKLKWLVRFCFLDTYLVGGLIGNIIAFAANSGNKHYKTIPEIALGKTLGPLIFPAGNKKPTVDLEKQPGIITIDPIIYTQYKALRKYNPVYRSSNGTIEYEETTVAMPLRNNIINLETIKASNDKVNADNKKDHLTIVYFSGNSGCFQQDYKLVAEDLLSYSKEDIPASAVLFNYPGILNSEGQVEISQDLVNSGIAQVQALLDQGIPHSKIVLHGVSLGGSIASHVAAHFHQLPKADDPSQKQTLGGLYASRTFASTAQVGRDYFNRSLGDNYFSRFLSTLCLPFIKLGTWGSNWDLDTGKAFFSIPPDKRNYSVVISPEANRKAYREQHKGSFLDQISNFIFGTQINPVDDPVLGRGLHDSWEKKFESFLIKWGFYGEEARKNYSAENSYRKMMVVDFKQNELAPDIDGHSKADYCYKQKGKLRNPAKDDKGMGIVHRAPPVTLFKKGKEVNALEIEGNEAGVVARRSMLGMSVSS